MSAEAATAIARSDTRNPSKGHLLARSCAAEWVRIWTVRATAGLLAVAALAMTGIGLLAGLGADPVSSQGDAAWTAATIAAMPAQFALLAFAVTAVASDYASGGITLTLQWTPRRGTLFLARALVVIGTATALGVLFALLSALAAHGAAPTLVLPMRQGLQALGVTAIVFAAGASLAVGLGFLLRSVAGAVITSYLLLLVLPFFLLVSGSEWSTTVAQLLPGAGAAFLLISGGPPGMTSTSAITVLVAWGLASLAAGWLRLTRDDANR